MEKMIQFEEPKVDVIRFPKEDVITDSKIEGEMVPIEEQSQVM